MRTSSLTFALALFRIGCLGGCLSGCFSLPDAEVASIRYFDVLAPTATSESGTQSPAWGLPFRIRRSQAAEPIGDRMLWRAGEHELLFADDLRWAEFPLDYVQRALTQELVQGRGLLRVEASNAPALDLYLRVFEEGFVAERSFRIVLDLRLLDSAGKPLVDRSVEAIAPVEGRDGSATARAASRALSELARRAADAVQAALAGA